MPRRTETPLAAKAPVFIEAFTDRLFGPGDRNGGTDWPAARGKRQLLESVVQFVYPLQRDIGAQGIRISNSHTMNKLHCILRDRANPRSAGKQAARLWQGGSEKRRVP